MDVEQEKSARRPAAGSGLREESPVEPGVEEVELGMGSHFHWVEEGDGAAPRPTPHGLLPTPPEVEAVVAQEEARLLKEHGMVPSPEARQRMVDSLKLQYYYDGIDIAYRLQPHGVEVLAVGLEEVGAFIRQTPPEQREGVVFGQG
jgi:hypothetical protein